MFSTELIHFPKHNDANGVLCVYECGREVPFDVRRVFTVSARAHDIRGEHAHKACTQLLVCISGLIRITCDDGQVINHWTLDNMAEGLLIPPRVWAKQEYMRDNSVLLVLCDRGYEAGDYIRNYSDFKMFVGSKDSK
jgi:dTDP-4-dehydrorhamnose 3,5-epimerase-like enzyme